MTNKKIIIISVIAASIFGSFIIFRYDHILKQSQVFSKRPWVNNSSAQTFSEAELLKLGWAEGDIQRKDSVVSYLNYPALKDQGTIRVGIFGGSRLLRGGANNGASYDFPALLQNRFKESGIGNVEILNFGASAYGFFQEYMLWDLLGKKYNLDYVVLTLNNIKWERDQSFFYIKESFYMHARYIVKNNQLTLIPVEGKTRSEAFRIYNRIVPPLRYILYDWNMPMFLKIFLPESLHNRANPFYYGRFMTKEKELIPIYSFILNDMSKKVKNLIVLTKDGSIGELQKRVDPSSIYFYATQEVKYLNYFMLREPRNLNGQYHVNRLGNKIVADELFSLLTGDVKPKLDCIKLSYDTSSNTYGNNGTNSPLSYYKDIYIKYGIHPLAYFTTFSGELFFRKRNTGKSDRSAAIWSLLMLPMIEWTDPVFIPMDRQLKNNEDIFFSFEKDKKGTKIPIGMVESSTGVFGQILLNSKTILLSYKDGEKNVKLVINDEALLSSIRGSDNFCIMIGDKKVLVTDRCFTHKILRKAMPNFCGKMASVELTLKPTISEYAYLSSKEEYFLDDKLFPANENKLDLVLSNGGQEVRYPAFLCKFVQADTVPFDKIYHPRITKPRI
ncbi:MAG: hypothetical protein NTZ95_03900 [Candidatus Omnitrophica bacterium]|nr:hypothetical protein [Candidatus Omnitrophota bacterium]